MEKPPQQQLVVLEDGTFAVQEGTTLTKIDSSSLPKVTTTVTPNYENTQHSLPATAPTDFNGTDQQIVGDELIDYTVKSADKKVVDNSTPYQDECSEEWHAQYGTNKHTETHRNTQKHTGQFLEKLILKKSYNPGSRVVIKNCKSISIYI